MLTPQVGLETLLSPVLQAVCVNLVVELSVVLLLKPLGRGRFVLEAWYVLGLEGKSLGSKC